MCLVTAQQLHCQIAKKPAAKALQKVSGVATSTCDYDIQQASVQIASGKLKQSVLAAQASSK